MCIFVHAVINLTVSGCWIYGIFSVSLKQHRIYLFKMNKEWIYKFIHNIRWWFVLYVWLVCESGWMNIVSSTPTLFHTELCLWSIIIWELFWMANGVVLAIIFVPAHLIVITDNIRPNFIPSVIHILPLSLWCDRLNIN